MTSPVSEATPSVVAGTADVGFDILQGVPAGLGYAPLDRQPLGVACALARPLARANAVTWSDLNGESILLAPPGVADGYNAFVRTQLRSFRVRNREFSPRLTCVRARSLRTCAD